MPEIKVYAVYTAYLLRKLPPANDPTDVWEMKKDGYQPFPIVSKSGIVLFQTIQKFLDTLKQDYDYEDVQILEETDFHKLDPRDITEIQLTVLVKLKDHPHAFSIQHYILVVQKISIE